MDEAVWVAIGSTAHAVRSRIPETVKYLAAGPYRIPAASRNITRVETCCDRRFTTEVLGELLALALDRPKCQTCLEMQW